MIKANLKIYKLYKLSCFNFVWTNLNIICILKFYIFEYFSYQCIKNEKIFIKSFLIIFLRSNSKKLFSKYCIFIIDLFEFALSVKIFQIEFLISLFNDYSDFYSEFYFLLIIFHYLKKSNS
jgi:hypothetical protein